MAGCSKKQYAIMMGAGPEGQKLASKMGKMEQPEFNKAFADLLQSDAATDASYSAEKSKWSKEEDEDYQDFDVTSDEDFEDEDRAEKISNDIGEYFEDSQLNDLKRYCDRYDYDFDKMKDELAKRFDEIQQKDNLSQKDAAEIALESLEDDIVSYGGTEEFLKDKIKEQKNDKFNELYDSLDGASDLDAWQDEMDKALEAGEISEEQYDELNEALDKKIDEQTQDNLDEDYGYLDPRNGQVVNKAYYDKYVKPNLSPEQLKEIEEDKDLKGSKKYIRKNGMIIVVDDDGNPTGEQYPDDDSAIDINGSIDDWEEVEDKNQDNKSTNEYKPKYKSEDFEDARFYPVSEEDKKAAGPRYLGRYHSIYDAHGLDDKDPGSWKKERDMFKYVGDSETGASIVQGPDGYYSGNPRINSMSFKTKEAAADYLDRKNPDEHKYGVYFEDGDERERVYRDAEDKYDLEAPDAYKNAREAAKKTEGLFNAYMDKIAKAPLEDLKYVESDLKYAGLTEEQNNKIREAVKQRQSEKNKLNYSPEMKKVKNAIKGLTLDSKEERRKLLLQMLDEIDSED